MTERKGLICIEISYTSYQTAVVRFNRLREFGTNPVTGTVEQHSITWPIQDPTHVNERRKKAGFDQTVEQNAKRLGIDYYALTMEQVKAMSGYSAFR